MFNDIFSALRGTTARVANVGSEEFAALIQEEDAVLLDVRTVMEFVSGHIPGSKNIDLMDPQFGQKVDGISRDSKVLLYCRSGNRSYHAGTMMKQMGFEHVYNLAPGIIGWRGEVTR
jgi:rhodanese-related sulfurtransferase